MAGTENFYGGSMQGMKPDYGDPIYPSVPSGNFALALDPRTANQLKEVSTKLNAGAKSAEVQLTFPQVADSIPDSHLMEINRLQKLIGVDLTLHGPLVDPTGFQGEGPWDETKRVQAERQIWNAIQRANLVKPDGNIVVTLHSSNGLPESESWEMNPETKKADLKRIAVINERTGQIGPIAPPRKEYLLREEGKEKESKDIVYDELKRMNRDQWLGQLSNLNLEVSRAKQSLGVAFGTNIETEEGVMRRKGPTEETIAKSLEYYDEFKKGKTAQQLAKEKGEDVNFIKEQLNAKMEDFDKAEIYVRDAYNQFRELYNQAYQAAESRKNSKADLEKLEEIKKEIVPLIDKEKGYLSDYKKLGEFSEVLNQGIQKLGALSEEPQSYKPLKDWGIEKSAETFGNVAFKAYEEFGSGAPVLSIENPPAGMGFSRAEDLRDIIKKAREVAQKKMMDEKGLPEYDAKKQAEKLIGATWDVGHINMIKKSGFTDEDLRKEAGTISPFINKIHLSDNFGFEHTELPMGMGNVPMRAHLQELKKAQGDKFDKIKQIIEVGNWYQHFQSSPFSETLSAFGSSIYGMKMSPSWNQSTNNFGGYFAGYGMNPEVHHATYGAGFSGLPLEVGGSVAGRSRFSGAPME